MTPPGQTVFQFVLTFECWSSVKPKRVHTAHNGTPSNELRWIHLHMCTFIPHLLLRHMLGKETTNKNSMATHSLWRRVWRMNGNGYRINSSEHQAGRALGKRSDATTGKTVTDSTRWWRQTLSVVFKRGMECNFWLLPSSSATKSCLVWSLAFA